MNRIWPLILIGFCFNCVAQKFDNVWPGGLNEYPGSPGSGNYLVRFDNGTPTVELADLKMNFESTVAAVSDSIGKLLFYTNGCWLARANGSPVGPFFSTDTVPLNPGSLHDSICPHTGYIVPKGAMLLPNPLSPDFHILLHMGAKYDEKWGLSYGPFYITMFHTTTGSYQLENEELLPLVLAPVAQVKRYEPFSVVRHGSGRGWWVVVPEFGKNAYHVFLMGAKTSFPIEKPIQNIGPNLKCKRIGSTVFSPDGSKFARVQNCGVVVMDFDRCNGIFSNPITINLPGYNFGGGGAAFSDDNSGLLLTSQVAVTLIDLTTSPPSIDTIINSDTLIGNSLHHVQLGPDDKLYVSSLQQTRNLSVIQNAFSSSIKYGHLDLPVNGVRSIPYFPNYDLYDWPNSPCDTLGINTPTLLTEPERIRFDIWPNPASTQVSIQLGTIGGIIEISDIFGRVLKKTVVNTLRVDIDLPDLPVGMYLVKYLDRNDKLISTKKLVLQN